MASTYAMASKSIDTSDASPLRKSEAEEGKVDIPHPSGDLVSLFRKNNSQYNNFIAFAAPKVSPFPQVSCGSGVDAVCEFDSELPPAETVSQEDNHHSMAVESRQAAVSGGKVSPNKSSKFTLEAARSHYRFNGLSIIQPMSLSRNLKKEPSGFESLIDHWLWDLVCRLWSEGYLKAFLLWVSWMTVGTSFYAIRNKFGWAKGFFMMVNVGYSIGTGYPREIDNQSLWFSVFNLLVGVIAIGMSLNAFAQSVLHSGQSWYESAEYDLIMADKTISRRKKVIEWLRINKNKICIIAAFLLWGSLMTLWASFTFHEWKFVQALYFSISSLSTGGLYSMPKRTARYNFVICGIFICFGVPLMCLAMGNFAAILLKFGDPEKDKQIIRGRITEEEIEMMKEFGMDDGDGYIDRAEFILLCAVRLGAATPELVEEINKRFVTLDVGKRGVLTRQELLQEKVAGINKLLNKKKNDSRYL